MTRVCLPLPPGRREGIAAAAACLLAAAFLGSTGLEWAAGAFGGLAGAVLADVARRPRGRS